MSLGKRLFIGGGAGAAACPTDSVQPFGAESAYSSNVALYEFENNANDTVGNHNASSSSDFSTDSKFGTYSFDITSSSVFDTGISNSELPVNGTWTCSAWVKPTGFSTNRAPISFTSWTTNYGWSLWVSTSGIAYPRVGTSLQGSGFSLTLNNWHHIVLTYDSSVLKFYVDKTLISQHTVTINTPNTNLRFGKSNLIFPTGNFGKLDQVRMYDKALSSDEVGILYNETTSTASDTNVLNEGSGVALYSLDYDASDAGGNYDGTPTDVDFGVDGQINWGAEFNGSSSKVEFTTDSNFVNDFTISAWINMNQLPVSGYLYQVVAWGDETAGKRRSLGIWNGGSGDPKVYFSGAYSAANFGGSTSVSANQWYHVCVTRSGSTVKVYLNGSIDGTGTVTLNSYTGTTGRIGTSGVAQEFFDGTIDQVRIFKKALSQNEIDTLYAETACVYTSTTDIVDYQGTNVAYYKLDNSAEDETGSYDGTETDITYEFGRYGQAAVFNGSSSKIVIPASNSIAQQNNYTFSAWFKTDTLGVMQTIYAFNSPSTYQSAIFIHSNGTNNIRIFSAGSNYYSSNNIYTNNQWYHIAVTKSSTNGIVAYLDGVSIINEPTATANNIQSSGGDNRIGGYKTSTESLWFDGSIDQVRIFDSALDATAVENLYNEKPEVNTSNFETVLYEGNGGSQYISNVGFKPDLVWMKCRNVSKDHRLYDSIRGTTHFLETNNTDIEGTSSTSLTSFNANGFTLGAASTSNSNNDNFVAWCWKAGGDAVLNEQGTIDSQVSANTAAGFSIVKWTGDTTSNPTVGHGLNQEPDLYIVKELDNGTVSWLVGGISTLFPETASAVSFLRLNTDDDIDQTGIATFGNSGDDLIKVGSRTNNGEESIAYCFHSVAGYQKVGSYTGNSSTTGPLVSVGFRPRFILVKGVTSGYSSHWVMIDSIRDTGAIKNKRVLANLNNNEVPDANWNVSFNSDGFQPKSTFSGFNDSNGTYIYLAIA